MSLTRTEISAIVAQWDGETPAAEYARKRRDEALFGSEVRWDVYERAERVLLSAMASIAFAHGLNIRLYSERLSYHEVRYAFINRRTRDTIVGGISIDAFGDREWPYHPVRTIVEAPAREVADQ